MREILFRAKGQTGGKWHVGLLTMADEVTGNEKADEVEYNETHAAFCRLHKGEMGVQYLFIDESIADRCEVTGNIYDNPAPADAT